MAATEAEATLLLEEQGEQFSQKRDSRKETPPGVTSKQAPRGHLLSADRASWWGRDGGEHREVTPPHNPGLCSRGLFMGKDSEAQAMTGTQGSTQSL